MAGVDWGRDNCGDAWGKGGRGRGGELVGGRRGEMVPGEAEVEESEGCKVLER